MDLKITKTLVIPSNEIKWRFSRSSGPGGQNVNKIESRVEIIFNLEDSKVLNDYQKLHILGDMKVLQKEDQTLNTLVTFELVQIQYLIIFLNMKG